MRSGSITSWREGEIGAKLGMSPWTNDRGLARHALLGWEKESEALTSVGSRAFGNVR
jgi:hypothetical protein